MKNKNEILTILEDEFVQLINMFNTWENRADTIRMIEELRIICDRVEVPFTMEWDKEDIKAITISGKRIEFENYTHCRKVTEVQNEESIY